MRNRIILLAVLLVFAMVAGALAEGSGITQKGIKAGVNIAGHRGSDTDDHHKSKTGFVGGGYLTYGFSPAIALQLELLYSQKGYKWEDGGWKETGKFDYLEIPVIFRYNIVLQGSTTPNLYAGLVPAFLLSAKEEWEYSNTGGFTLLASESGSEDVKDKTNSFDFGFAFGGGVDIAVGNGILLFDARYTLGLTKIDSREDPNDIKNQAISLMVGYGFK
jgi:hypothetical protein